jgi:hypothetical protein
MPGRPASVSLSVAMAALAALAACKSSDSRAPAAAPPEPAPAATAATTRPAARAAAADDGGPAGCQAMPFATQVDLPEASGATYLPATDDSPAALLVVGDSQTLGAFALVDADTGATLARGQLPLDRGASDDLEGLARVGDDIYGLTSSGYLRRFRRVAADRFELEEKAYPLGSAGTDGVVCAKGRAGNCGRNWEGLCLRDPPPDGDTCAGFAASRRDGQLMCLVRDSGGHYRADPSRTIDVTGRESLAGCAYQHGDTLLAGSNLLDAARVYRVTGTDDPATAQVTSLGPLGVGFPEAIATGPDGSVYRFSDLGSAPSLMSRVRCR